MGRRHLLGLARAGIAVDAVDPSAASRAQASAQLAQNGLDPQAATFIESPAGKTYDVAVFSEPADLRFANVASFLRAARAGRYLLEKPISADPAEVERYPALFAAHGVAAERVVVNFARRLWPHTASLKALAESATEIAMTVTGGAFGLGGNGIHHIDLFLHLTGLAEADLRYVTLAPTRIASGRGQRFSDFGGEIVLANGRGIFHAICLPTSSAAAVITIVGDTFCGTLDERTLHWTLAARQSSSTLPNYRCGADYEVVEDGPAQIVAMDVATGLWAQGEADLPSLLAALAPHRLLHAALLRAGVVPPFAYT